MELFEVESFGDEQQVSDNLWDFYVEFDRIYAEPIRKNLSGKTYQGKNNEKTSEENN